MTDNTMQHFGSYVEVLQSASSNWDEIWRSTHTLMISVCSEASLIGDNLIRLVSDVSG
jgi:hypothetical protein